MAKVIILNGPIGCGKDTIGGNFAADNGFGFTSFKEPMFRIAANTLSMDYDTFLSYYSNREWKDSPNENLNGRTVRELMIHISETYIKPFLGDDYFGQQALSYINRRPWVDTFVFSDGGFKAEIEVLAESHEVILVHMYKDGCTFEGDSRSYVLTNRVPVIHTLNNNGTIQEGVDELGRILDAYEDNSRPIDEPVEDGTEDPAATPRAGQRRSNWLGRAYGASNANQIFRDGFRGQDLYQVADENGTVRVSIGSGHDLQSAATRTASISAQVASGARPINTGSTSSHIIMDGF